MNPRRILMGIPVSLLLVSVVAQAAIHTVTVGAGDFSPNDITIAPGDTVRFDNPKWSGKHDVTADDGSWASPQASEFVYDKTFDSVGDVLYHCSIHSSPGLDRNTHMNGIIRVQAGGGDPGGDPVFQINEGLSDAWYWPGTSGQGFFITVWEDSGLVFLSWFTFDTTLPPDSVAAVVGDPGHRWLTAQGPYDGDTATLKVYDTAGGIFDAPNPKPANTEVGTIEITWTDCNSGMLTYDLPGAGLDGEIPIERIVLDHVPLCEELSAP